MLKRSVVGLAVAGLAFSYAPAFADPPETNGLICQFASIVDPTAEAGTQSGQLSGGPVLLTEQSLDPDLPGTTPETGTLICTIQVNQSTPGGVGPAVSSHGTGVFTAGPSIVNYHAGDTDNVYLCSSFVDDSDGVTYYWDDENGEWSASAATPCSPAFGNPTPPEEDLINLIPCPFFAQLPSPAAELIQETWGDCAGQGPNNVIVAAGTGDTGVLHTPPLWSCTLPSGTLVTSSGSVKCQPPGLNSLVNCMQVWAVSTGLAVPPPPTVTATHSTTTKCNGSLTTTATVENDTTPLLALNTEVGFAAGTPLMTITCIWDSNPRGSFTAWVSICNWNN